MKYEYVQKCSVGKPEGIILKVILEKQAPRARNEPIWPWIGYRSGPLLIGNEPSGSIKYGEFTVHRSEYQHMNVTPNVVVEWLALLLRIR
jgi:hypothetical protein